MGLFRAFDPSFAYGKVDDLWVQRLADVTCLAHIPNIANDLKRELPDYLRACKGTKIEHGDVPASTKGVLMSHVVGIESH